MANLWVRKPLSVLQTEAGDSEKGLKRTLGAPSLVALGIGAIIGAGLFVRTAAAAANAAGPSVTLGFVVAALGCAFAGLCYAELASMIPIAGSAYTYSYATMGELVAWIIGWDLVLEYAIGAATVAIAWSEYLNKLLGLFGAEIPYAICHSPFQTDPIHGTHGIINIPALAILLALTLLLIRGMQESALVNAFIVVMKVTIVLLIIALGWGFTKAANHTPYIPEPSTYTDMQGVVHAYGGVMGILGAAGIVFFAFIGFDAVSTAAQEAKNPARDMPIGILGSLVICTVLYILFAHVLTGLAPVDFFRHAGSEASVARAIDAYMPGYTWLSNAVTVAILGGFSSVILVMLMGQSRVFYSMSRDGLVPAAFSDVHPRYRTPYKSNWLFFGFVGLFAAFIPEDIVGDMSSIGTLFAFVLVCIGVWVMRVKEPDAKREFRVPAVKVVSVLGVVVCGSMIFGLGWPNWTRLGVWLVIGLILYFSYGIKRSKLQQGGG
ncbi:MAG: amino acid permease [Polyangiaceae bacterium]|jgi:basic amino acid/polyamine antiporter, APA family